MLSDLGIVGVMKIKDRKRYIFYEPPVELGYVREIKTSHEYLIRRNSVKVAEMILKISSQLSGGTRNGLTPHEAYLLSDWTGLDIGRYLKINFGLMDQE